MQQQDVSANLAGKSPRQLGQRWHTRRKIIGLSALGLIFIVSALSILYFVGNRISMFQTGGLLLLCVSFLIMRAAERIAGPEMEKLFRHEKRARQGAVAGKKIGALLDGLPGNYAVQHDIPAGRSNIDHLVFRGDGAIFLIETKSHSGWISRQDDALRRNGLPLEKDFIQQTLEHVSWLKHFLKARVGFEPWIHAAVVFTGADVEKNLKLKNVDVFNARHLPRWLERSSGNPRASVFLWPQVESLKNELAAPDSIHLACQPLLR
ncbi:MAG TPA: nuclease-related domain-containing protein [Candidatus Sulfopaludibacter sp.]|nr:nuclease-related domain-containing protein [Candidatus Sulfopaludibacter sp.]